MLKSCKLNASKLRNIDTEFARLRNFKDVRFPVHKKNYSKIGKKDVSINGFEYKNKKQHCIYTSKQTFEKHADLLLLFNTKNFCYALIKDFIRFMIQKQRNMVRSIFVDVSNNASLAQEYQTLQKKIVFQLIEINHFYYLKKVYMMNFKVIKYY